MSDSDSKKQSDFVKMLANIPPGPELDDMVANVVFDYETEECAISESKNHIAGSYHADNWVTGEKNCYNQVPRYSTDWSKLQILMEWLTDNFPGLEFIFDCGKWSVNINESDKQNKYYRVVHTSVSGSLQETACKAAILVIMYPQKLPLEFRTTVVMDAKPRVKEKKNGRSKK